MRTSVSRGGLVAVLMVALLSSGWASPPQAGIAARYARDAGIENDPDVVMAEMFEESSVGDVVRRWTKAENVGGMSLALDVPAPSDGTRSLGISSLAGVNSGGSLYKALAPGHEQLYLRYYIKYSGSGRYHHTGGWIGGYNPPTAWPQGGAGDKPTGQDRFSIGPEPVNDKLRFDLYTYWMEMRPSPTGHYWGNTFVHDPGMTVTADRWTCVEVMVKMNSPVSARNGELALWIDGRQVIHLREGSPRGRWNTNMFFRRSAGSPFEGFRWRAVDALNLNWVWLLYYTTRNAYGRAGHVWFDHVVLAKDYVGPLNVAPSGDGSPPMSN